VTSPPSNGVARKLADNKKSDGGNRMLRVEDATASTRMRHLHQLTSESRTPSVSSTHSSAVFIKNNSVKFELGRDDDLCDVVANNF